jgi:hypothetical protein
MPPNVTDVVSVKPMPVIVTAVPPSKDPELTESDVMAFT